MVRVISESFAAAGVDGACVVGLPVGEAVGLLVGAAVRLLVDEAERHAAFSRKAHSPSARVSVALPIDDAARQKVVILSASSTWLESGGYHIFVTP